MNIKILTQNSIILILVDINIILTPDLNLKNMHDWWDDQFGNGASGVIENEIYEMNKMNCNFISWEKGRLSICFLR